MDLQFKFVNDGLAQTYESPEKPNLPDWAVWKDQAYAVTAEPIVFAYNRALMPPADVPHSHYELADLLRRKPGEYRGKIATYDPERSATGYLYYTQDLLLSHDTLDLVQAAGRAQPSFYVSGVDALNRLSSGQHLLAYNMVSSYMLERQEQDPNIGIVFPSDYTLVMSRVAVIPRTARHPAAARRVSRLPAVGTGANPARTPPHAADPHRRADGRRGALARRAASNPLRTVVAGQPG